MAAACFWCMIILLAFSLLDIFIYWQTLAWRKGLGDILHITIMLIKANIADHYQYVNVS